MNNTNLKNTEENFFKATLVGLLLVVYVSFFQTSSPTKAIPKTPVSTVAQNHQASNVEIMTSMPQVFVTGKRINTKMPG